MIQLDDYKLNQLRKQGDHYCDELVGEFLSNGKSNLLYEPLMLPVDQIENVASKSEVKKFLLDRQSKPNWLETKKIISGQKLFMKYASEVMMLLGSYSLPYCYAGSPGNKALYLSEKMRQSPAKRLLDTAQFVIQVSTLGNLTENNLGHIQIRRTRLYHAIARYYLIKSDWNETWGEPINQEDMAGTNLSFSHLILNGLKRLGFSLTSLEENSFIHLWRYIGYQLGIKEDLLPENTSEASKLNSKIVKRSFRYSIEGEELTNSLIEYYKTVVSKEEANFIDAQIYSQLGPKVSSHLGLRVDKWKLLLLETRSMVSAFSNSIAIHQHSFNEMKRQFDRSVLRV